MCVVLEQQLFNKFVVKETLALLCFTPSAGLKLFDLLDLLTCVPLVMTLNGHMVFGGGRYSELWCCGPSRCCLPRYAVLTSTVAVCCSAAQDAKAKKTRSSKLSTRTISNHLAAQIHRKANNVSFTTNLLHNCSNTTHANH